MRATPGISKRGRTQRLAASLKYFALSRSPRACDWTRRDSTCPQVTARRSRLSSTLNSTLFKSLSFTALECLLCSRSHVPLLDALKFEASKMMDLRIYRCHLRGPALYGSRRHVWLPKLVCWATCVTIVVRCWWQETDVPLQPPGRGRRFADQISDLKYERL